MREFLLVPFVSSLAVLGSVGCVATAQCPNRGTVVVEGISNAQGKPFQAKETRTIVTYGSDGTKQIVVIR